MTLYIVSVGPGDPELLNTKTAEALRGGGKLILRTGRHPLTAWLEKNGISFRTMDHVYESADDFEVLSDSVAAEVWKLTAENGTAIYAVSDTMTDHTVDALFAGKPENGEIAVLPGFSFADFYLPACHAFFPVSDIRICPASSFSGSGYDPSRPLLVTELNDGITAGEVKNYLSSFVKDEETVIFFEKNNTPRPVPLYELDRQPFYNHLSAVAAGSFSYDRRSRKTLGDLMSIMNRLRAPDGCPWDREQTHESLRPYVVEEAWEVVDAIHENRPAHLAEELGDLMFQIVFHESIGRSFDEFTMDDILEAVCEKMIRRHPHVFGKNGCPADNPRPEAFNAESWDRIKQAETGSRSPVDAMNDISAALPSLRYAEKVLRKLEQIPCFEKPSEAQILSAVRETAGSMEGLSGNAENEKRLGKLLFLCAEFSRKLGTDAEIVLHQTMKRVTETCRSLEKDGIIASDAHKPLTFNDLGL